MRLDKVVFILPNVHPSTVEKYLNILGELEKEFTCEFWALDDRAKKFKDLLPQECKVRALYELLAPPTLVVRGWVKLYRLILNIYSFTYKVLGRNLESLLVKEVLPSSQHIFAYYTKLSLFTRELRRKKVSIVIIDNDLEPSNRVMTHACRKAKVSSIIIQHSHGYGVSYSNIPSFVDFYISYGEYNSEILKSIVSSSQVIETGNFYSEAPSEWASERKILVALKPFSNPSYKLKNEEILHWCLNNCMDYSIHIKLHPIDSTDYAVREKIEEKVSSQKLAFVSSDLSLTSILHQYDLLVTLESYTVVDSLLLSVPVLCFHSPNDLMTWPDWSTCSGVDFRCDVAGEPINVQFVNELYSQINISEIKRKFNKHNLSKSLKILNMAIKKICKTN